MNYFVRHAKWIIVAIALAYLLDWGLSRGWLW